MATGKLNMHVCVLRCADNAESLAWRLVHSLVTIISYQS
jgi:hypothetical protein